MSVSVAWDDLSLVEKYVLIEALESALLVEVSCGWNAGRNQLADGTDSGPEVVASACARLVELELVEIWESEIGGVGEGGLVGSPLAIANDLTNWIPVEGEASAPLFELGATSAAVELISGVTLSPTEVQRAALAASAPAWRPDHPG